MLFEEKDPDLLLAFGMLHSLMGNCLLVKFSSANQRPALHMSLWELQLLHSERRKKNQFDGFVLPWHEVNWYESNVMMRVLKEPEWILMAVKADFGRTFKGGLDADRGPEFTELKVGRLHAQLRHGVWEQPSWRWEPCKFSPARKKQVLTFSINYNDYSCTMACLFHDLPRKYFVYLRSWCRLRGHNQWHTRASCVLSSFLDIKEDNKYSCSHWMTKTFEFLFHLLLS